MNAAFFDTTRRGRGRNTTTSKRGGRLRGIRLAVTAGLIASIGVVTGTGGSTPTALAVPPGSVAFSENFNAGAPAGWTRTDTGRILFTGGEVRFDNLDNEALTSPAYNLSGLAAASVRFEFNDDDANESIQVHVINGGSAELVDFNNVYSGTFTFPIPAAYLAAGTQVRFRGASSWESDDRIDMDNFQIVTQANPDLPLSCGIDVVMVLDESGSISPYEANVISAVNALVSGLQDTGSQLRFTEFSSSGRKAQIGGTTAFQPVTATLATQVQAYLNSGTFDSASSYQPSGTTNWEAGLFHAADNPGPGDLVVFITDGEPNQPNSNSDIAAALAEDELDSIRSTGAHVLGIAVGTAATSTTNFNRLRNTIEPAGAEVWSGTGALNISTVDLLSISSFSQLTAAMQEVVFSLCSPSVSITKTDDAGTPIENHQFLGQVDVAHTGPTDQYELVQPTAAAGIYADGADPSHSALTGPSGVATFRWIPNTLADPQPWNSSFTFTETLDPGWTISASQAQCQIKRLSSGNVTNHQADLGVSQNGSVVTFNLYNPNTTDPFVITKGDIVTCSVVNQRPATITIVKDAQPNSGTAFGFTSTGGNGLPGAFSLTDDGSPTSSTTVDVPAGNYSVTENSVPGWAQSLSCVTAGGSTANANQGTRTATITATPGSTTTCTYVNVATANLVLEKTWLVGQNGDTATLTADVGQNGVDRTFPSVATGANPQTDTDATTIPIVLGDVIDLAEVVAPAVDYTSSLTCVDSVSGVAITGLTTAADGRSGTLTTAANGAAAGATITCTFENPYRRATVKVVKATVPATDNGQFTLGISTAADGQVATTTGGNGAETSILLEIGDSVTVSEIAGNASTDLTNYTSTVSCTGPGFSDSDGSFDIPLSVAGDTITCTYTNTRKTATVTLAKSWVNAVVGDAVNIAASRSNAPSDAGALSFDSPADNPTETDTGTPATVYAGETLTLSESFTSGNANLYEASLDCTGAADTNESDGVTVGAADSTIVCTYTNTRKSATFTLDKAWGDAAAGEVVNLDADGTDPANGQIIDTTATAPNAAAATNSMTVYAGETISFDETFALGANATNYNTSLSCTDGIGATVDPGNRGGSYAVGTNPVDVTCTFTNSLKQSGVIVQKVWVNGATGDTADLTASIGGGTAVTDQSVAPAAPVVNSNDEVADNVVSIPAFVGNTVDFGETLNAPANYTTTWACDDTAGSSGTGLSGSVTVAAADEGETITCTITNTRKSANLTLTKDWATSPANGDSVSLAIAGGAATPVAGVNTNDDGTAIDVDATSVVYAGENLTLSEVFPNAANYDTGLACVGGGTLTYTNGLSGTVAIAAGDADGTITCTFTNTRKSTTLTLEKDWVSPATGDETTLSIDATNDDSDLAAAPVASAGQTVTSTQTSSVTVYAGETVELAEALDPNATNTGTYSVSGFTCTAGTFTWVTDATDLSVALSAADVASAITCTVTNTRNSAEVTLAKTWVDPVGGTTLDLAGAGNGFGGDDTIDASLTSPTGGNDSMTVYSGESVALSEAFASVADRGYFTSTLTCGVDVVTTSLSATGHSYSFTVADDPADMTCTFNNVRKSAPITLDKTWVDGATGDSALLTIDGTVDDTSDPAVVPAGGDGVSTETAASTAYAGETITLSEAFGTNDGSYNVTAFTCAPGTVAGWSGATDLNATLAITTAMVGDGSAPIACSITNTRRSAELTLVKDWVDPASGPASVTLSAAGDDADAADSDTAVSTSPTDSSSAADTVTITVLSGETVTLSETFGTDPGQLGSDYYDTTFACGTDAPAVVGLSTAIDIPASPTDMTCEFTNTRRSFTLDLAKSWVAAVAGDEATLSIDATNDADNSADPSVAPDGDGTSTSDVSVTAYYGETVTLSETLDNAGNTALYTSTNLTCDAATPNWVADALSGSVVVPGGDGAPTEVTCTFENTAQRGTVVVVKSVDGADGTFDFDGSWPATGATIDPATVTDPSDFSITTSGNTGTVTFTDVLVPKTGTYSIGEADPRPNYDGTNVTCSDADQGSGPSASSDQPLVGTVELDAGETVTCTFTNTQRSTIVIIKDAQPDSDADFSFSTTEPATTSLLDNGFSLDDDADGTLSNTFTSVLLPAGAQYTVTEAASAGWSLDASSSCSAGGSFNGTTASITPAAGATVTCTFVNTADPVGLTATKAVSGVTGPWGDFTFTLSGGAFTGSADQIVNSADVDALWENLVEGSTYTLTESVAAGYQPGATFECTVTLPGQGQTPTALVDGSAAAGFQFTATAGATYSCDITNVAVDPTLTIQKTTLDAVGSFVFDIEPTTGGTAVGDITVTTTDVTNPAQSAAVDLEAGIGYSVTEQANGTWVAGALTCTVTPAGGAAVPYVADTPTQPGDVIACSITNTAPADVGVTKTATTDVAVLQPDGSYQTTYTVVATNSGIGSETFDVTDTPTFAPGTTITEVTVDGNVVTDGADGVVDGTYLVAEDVTLDGSVSEPYDTVSYTVVVSFTVAATVTQTQRDCVDENEDGTGSLNVAQVLVDGQVVASDNDCAEIPDPDISASKTVLDDQPVLVSGNTYTVSYDVVVTNDGQGPGTYVLTDTPTFGAGTSITSVTVDDVAVVPVAGVYTFATDVDLAANTAVDPDPSDSTATYRVVVTFTVAGSTTPAARDCVLDQGEDGTGLLNTVAVDPNIGPDASDTACVEIPDPDISASKTVLDDQPVLVSGNTYTVSYDVVVTNDGQGPGTYVLTDTPTFGAGTSITSVTVDDVAVVPVAGVYTFATDVDLAANTAVDPDPSDSTATYRVVVTFTVAGSTTPAARDCVLDQGEDGTGLLNTVAVDPNIGPDASDTACVEIPDPDISASKTVLDDQPVLVSGNTYTVSYDVVVTNDGQGPGTYVLTDTPTFGAGTSITSVTVDDVAVVPVAGVYTFATDVALDGTTAVPSDSTATYRVVVTFTVAGSTTPAARDCVLDQGEDGTGLLNTAEVTPNIGEPDPAEDCVEIPDPDVSTTKTAIADTATFLGDELYEVAYDVVATNAGDGPGTYVLTDTPSFGPGVTVVSATVDAVAVNPLTATFPVASGSINAGATLTYRVVIRFTVEGKLTASESTCSGLSGVAGEGTFNSVTIDPNIGPNDTDEDCADIPTLDLQIVKTDGGASAVAGGDPFSYTISVSNIGDRDADANDPVTVTDTLPAGLVWVSFPGNCNQTGQTLTCDLDPTDLTAGGDAVVLTLSARALTTAASGSYTNVAVVDTEDDPVCEGAGCTPPPCPANSNNNVDCEVTPVARVGSIQIVKTDDVAAGEFVEAGDQFSYGLVVTNNGLSSVLPGLEVTDDLPAELTLVSAVGGAGWTCSAVDPVVCTYGPALAPGASAPAIIVTVQVAADADVDTIDNLAAVIGAIDRDCSDEAGDFDNFEEACNEVTDEDTETTPMVSNADLSIDKSSSVETIGAGSTFDWVLDVSNDGPATAVNVVVTDTIPSRATIIGVTSDDFDCDIDGQDVTCTVASLASGATGQVAIEVLIAASDDGGEISNIGNVGSDTPDPDLTNNTDEDPVDVVAQEPPTPTTVAPPAPVVLPKTGNSGTGAVLRSALLLIALGGFVLLIARRGRRDDIPA